VDKKTKRAIKIAFINAAVVIAIFVLSFANIHGRVDPFAIAFLFAVVFVPAVSPWCAGVAAFVFSLFTHYGRTDILGSGFAVAVFFVTAFVYRKLYIKYRGNKKWKKFKLGHVFVFFMYALSTALGFYFAGGNMLEIYVLGTNAIVGVIFLSASAITLNAAAVRFNRVAWTVDQTICAGVVIAIMSLGAFIIDYPYFNIVKFIALFALLCLGNFSSPATTMVAAVTMGVGMSLESLNLVYVAVYSVFALSVIAFRAKERILSVVAMWVTDAVLGIYFNSYIGYTLYDILPTVLAGVLFLILPRAVKRFFSSYNILGAHLVSKNTINRNRAGIYKRLDNLAAVFNEMQNIYKSLVSGCLPRADTAKMCAKGVIESVCGNCESRPNCRRDITSNDTADKNIEKLCLAALERGSVTYFDLAPDTAARCTRVNSIISSTNTVAAKCLSGEKSAMQMDASKVLMAGLLSGMSRLCKTFCADALGSVVFDAERAAEVRERLLSVGVTASDCLITKSADGDYNISVLVPRADAQNTAIEAAAGRAVGHRVCVDGVDDADTAGFAVVTLRSAPKYNLTFGVAQIAKNFNLKNGDTFTFLKINANQTMMAVCDGMGAGERAHRASVLALSLVENFYKAGFPNEVIMESVNQLLIITSQDVFSAIDIAVFSQNDGSVSFIKVGGVDGFIKRDREIEVVEAGSLPMGIVEEMTPKITRTYLKVGDFVVLVSDGVTDSFGDKTKLGSFINNTVTRSPQKLADEIAAEALRRTDKIAIDDITVVVGMLN
jgi:stage II sporulation protein E